MNYGYFDDPDREYVITDPRTPTKWINYIGTLQLGGFVDPTGRDLICKNDLTFYQLGLGARGIRDSSQDLLGATYFITVNNPKHVCKGVEKISVKGGRVEGCLIRADEGASDVYVEVTLG